MIRERLYELAERYARLHIAVVGDFCLDRYLDIDPNLKEVSIETGREVHNVVRVRAQPGGAGTVLNNLVALGVGTLSPIGVAGDDGEGYELHRALQSLRGVQLNAFLRSPRWRTFTYCKPMLLEKDGPPVELNRLDSKNWSPMPADLESNLIDALTACLATADAVAIMDQVDIEGTGTVTRRVREVVADIASRLGIPVLADCRRTLADFPPMMFKMNAGELARFCGVALPDEIERIGELAKQVAARTQAPAFVTLAERGILAAAPDGQVHHAPALPSRGPIDIVGAGDCVTANLIAAIASGATLPEATEVAMLAASLVIHQLGTTGTAGIDEIAEIQSLLLASNCL